MDDTSTGGIRSIVGSQRVRQAVLALLVIGALFLAVKTVNELKTFGTIGKNTIPTNTITVSGHGEAVAIPDIATFSFTVSQDAATVAVAQKTVNEKITAALNYLKSVPVADADVQ